jgi:hypothetical protein
VVREKKNQIEYFKAWNMGFKYHGYNLDLNNEIPYKCVPNALVKMYGKKDTKRRDEYISAVKNGGIEYVEKCLNNYYDNDGLSLDPLDVDFYDENKIKNKGYTPMDILRFCNEHKIKCFGYDWKLNQFMTNKYENIKFNEHLSAFVFYFNDEHIYLIDDKELRNSLLHTNGQSGFISMIANSKQNVSDKDVYVDLLFEDWTKVEKSKIYITTPGLVHNKFYQLLCGGDIYNCRIKMNDKEGIIRFQYENKNLIIYNPDYHIVNKTIQVLNNGLDEVKYKFENQRIHTLAREYLDKEFGGIPKSSFNKSGNHIFHSDFIKNTVFNGWFSESKTKNLSAFDYNKHYTSCLMGIDIKFGFPIYSVFDEVKSFGGVFKTGFYYIETSNFYPFKGNGWYDADLVFYGVQQSIITMNDIKSEYVSSHELKPQYFEKFIKSVYSKFEKAKLAIYGLIGLFGHDYITKNIHHFTTDSRHAFHEIVSNDQSQIKHVYHDEFNNTELEKPIDMDNINIDDHISHEKPVCYHLYDNSKIHMFQNDLPLFYKIYNISAIKMHQMSAQIGAKVRGIFTDTIIFEGPINEVKLDDKTIGGIRKTDIKPFTKLTNIEPRNIKYEQPKVEKLNKIEAFKLEDNKGVFITGNAGTGKTYLTNQLKSQLDPSTYRTCTPTHKSALLIGGETIFSLFNINPHDFTYLKSKVDKMKEEGVKYIFIDEVSMIQSKLWAVLRDIKNIYKFKFILVGDFNQLDPVEEKTYDILNSEIFSEIADGQMLELTKNWRAENDPEFKEFIDDLELSKHGKFNDVSKYGNKEQRKSLAWTNKTRKAINYKWMMKESSDKKHIIVNNFKVFKSLPVICKKTSNIKEIELKNNEEFEVIDFDDKTITIKNSRLEASITHKDFKHFDLAYCITVHCAQGSTFDFPYSIYEYRYFSNKLLYTAMSRSTQKSNINFMDYHPQTFKGYIYKITDTKGKVYIGSTNNPVERFKSHKQAKEKMPLHEEIRNNGCDGWTFEVIKEVDVIEEEQLFIHKTVEMIKFDSVNTGYNTKYSVDITNLY